FADRGRDATHDLLDQLGHALPGLGADGEDVLGRAPHDLGELAPGLVDVGLRKGGLVEPPGDDQPGVPGGGEVGGVRASIPCAASTRSTAPSQAARERETSYVKSTWPGVSIRFSSWS